MEILILLTVAIAPAIAFLAYILSKDKLEPEPHGMIIKALLLGGAVVIPAGILEIILEKIVIFQGTGLLSAAIKSFVLIAPIEELCKLLVVLLFIWKDPNFNEENDGIVYVGTVAIGFAMLENIFYVIDLGFSSGVMRAVTAIPLHTFTGVFMGYYVGLAKFAPPEKKSGLIFRGFFAAYLLHAVYDTFALSGSALGLLLFPLVVGIFIAGAIYLKKGKLMSHARWGDSPPVQTIASSSSPSQDDKPSSAETRKDISRFNNISKIKVIVSRSLFVLCAGFWFLLILGIIDGTTNESSAGQIIVGGIIMTFIPILIGIYLEVSCYRSKKQ